MVSPIGYTKFKELAERRHNKFAIDESPDYMLCETEHFFVINAKGAFVPGYVLIIPKHEEWTSLIQLNPEYLEEFLWLKQQMELALKKKYNHSVFDFEHGTGSTAQCGIGDRTTACLSQAHLHVIAVRDTDGYIPTILNSYSDEPDFSKPELLIPGKGKQEFKRLSDCPLFLEAASYPEVSEFKQKSYIHMEINNEKVITPSEGLRSQFGRRIACNLSGVDESNYNWRAHAFEENMRRTASDLADTINAIGFMHTNYGFKSCLLPERIMKSKSFGIDCLLR